MREVQRKLDAQTELLAAGGTPCNEPSGPKALSDLLMWLERAERRENRADLAARARGLVGGAGAEDDGFE